MEPNPYELEPEPVKPVLPGTVVVRDTIDDVIDVLAIDLFFQAKACVRGFGDFHMALSGGETPQPFYRRLMIDPALRDFPWKRTHLWIVDERCVPFDDERSNYGMIKQTLAQHADIPGEQVHPMPIGRPDGDLRYEKELRSALEWRERGHDRLDFALLGVGQDGHTASLFPDSPGLDADDRLVVFNEGPGADPPERMTMTLNLLNASRFIAVLVTGSNMRQTVGRIADRDGSPRELPILGVEPLAGTTRWYLDRAACPEP